MDLAPLAHLDTCQLLCAWCGQILRPCRNPLRTSHGICRPCMVLVLSACAPSADEELMAHRDTACGDGEGDGD